MFELKADPCPSQGSSLLHGREGTSFAAYLSLWEAPGSLLQREGAIHPPTPPADKGLESDMM